jgi:DNA-3-methyladenine glycosylase
MSKTSAKILPPEFFRRNAVELSRALLGKRLVVIRNGERLSGIINETEAYRGKDDPASHAFPGITPRNRIMHETYGHAYVYFVYGMYDCLNFTAEDTDVPGAVLIRSIIPSEGAEAMERNRGRVGTAHLADGPGKLCRALGVSVASHNGKPLTKESGIFVEDTGFPVGAVEAGPRIGIKKGLEMNWRFRFRA